MTYKFIANTPAKAIAIFNNLYHNTDFAKLFQISARKYAISTEYAVISELFITAKLIAEKN